MSESKNRQQQAARINDVLRVAVDPATITPLGEMVLIEKLPEGTTEAGLVLPDSVKMRNRARVHATGPGHLCESGERVSVGVKPGDLVILGPGAMMAPIGSLPNGNPLALITEGHILAIDSAAYESTMRVEGKLILGGGETLQ